MSGTSKKRPRTPPPTMQLVDLTSSPIASPAHKKTNVGPPNPTSSSIQTTTSVSESDKLSQLYQTISALPPSSKDALLYTQAVSSSSLQSQIYAAAQAAPIFTFDDEIGRVELCIGEGEGGWNPMEADIPDPQDEVPAVIAEVLARARAGTRYETRRNALFALGRVFEIVLLEEEWDRVGAEEKEAWMGEAIDAIDRLLYTMGDAERTRVEAEPGWQDLEAVAGMEGAEDLYRSLTGDVGEESEDEEE